MVKLDAHFVADSCRELDGQRLVSFELRVDGGEYGFPFGSKKRFPLSYFHFVIPVGLIVVIS